MKTSFLFPCALMLFPFSLTVAAGEDATPAVPDAACARPCFAVTGGSASAVFYQPTGAGPAGTVIDLLARNADETFHELSILIRIFTADGRYEVPKATSLSGTMGGFDLGCDLSAGNLGNFTVEIGGLTGSMDYDSGVKPFSGTVHYVMNGVPGTAFLHGMMSRSSSLDIDRASALVLWRPAKVGDWLGAGLEFSHEEYCADYRMQIGIALSGALSDPIDITTDQSHVDFRSNDVLLHVRLGGVPFKKFTAASGRFGVIPKCDLALGYSLRQIGTIEATTTDEDGVTSTKNLPTDGAFDDVWVFRGSAALSFFYKLSAGTLALDAGYAYSRDFDGNDKTDQSGFTARLGYSLRR